MFEIKNEQFAGPLDLLLQLIEEQELEITEVSLAQVAGEYLKYVNQHSVPAEELADFLVIATRLLYIKSRAILPEIDFEEEESAGDLAAQLRMYKEFVEASKLIDDMYKNKLVSFARSKPVTRRAEFAPPKKQGADALAEAMERIIKKLEPFLALQRASLRKVISVQERIKNIHDAIMSRANLTFKQISGGGSKVDTVTSFLALLELVKQRIVSVSQTEIFDEISIKRVD